MSMRVRTWVVGLAVASQALACGESSSDGESTDERGGSAGQASGGTTGGSLATGGGGASGGSLATGGVGASGGSVATGGSATGGSVTAGSGGASAGSSSGGSGGKNSNYGNPLPVDPRCEAFALRTASACPGEWSFETAHVRCQDFLNELNPMGCGSGFDEFVTCEGEIDCVHGYARSCADAFRECANGFVEDTACVREGAGITCPEGSFAFICRIDVPEPCMPTEGVGSATRACCPPFGTDSRG